MKSRVFSLIALSLIFTSCSYLPKWKNDNQPQIRIVDLQGKTHPVVTKVPELNTQALASQGNSVASPIVSSTKKPIQIGEVKYQNYQEQNLANAQATNVFPQGQQPASSKQETGNNEALQVGAGKGNQDADQEVEYDLTENKSAPKAEKSLKKLTNKSTTSATSGTKFFVQVGSFSTKDRADLMLNKMKKFHSGKIETVEGEKTIYRALLGPLSNKTKARELAKKITSTGQDAIITKSN